MFDVIGIPVVRPDKATTFGLVKLFTKIRQRHTGIVAAVSSRKGITFLLVAGNMV